MSALALTLFGRFQAALNGDSLPGFRTAKVQALLIYLATESAAPHRRESLMTLLWPGMPDRSARQNLRQIIYNLRRAVPDLPVKTNDGQAEATVPLLLANRKTIQLNPQADVASDVAWFETLTRAVQTHDHMDLFLCHDCKQKLETAVTLYTGDFLADFYLDDSNEFEEWAEVKRQSCRRQALDALETLTAIATRQTTYAEARAYAEQQLEIDNLRESAYRQLMKVMALNGQRTEALALYDTCARLLADELGMAPTSRTTEVYEQIRSGDLSFAAAPAQAVRGFELKEKIGEGAYGAIHRAIQPAVGREVAVKVIRRKYADDPEFIRRFEAEAQTVARLEHPYIVPLYDYWREPAGAYLVMRLLRGGNLLTSLEGGPWQLEPTLKMVEQLTSALAAAHRQGVIHRDIKPANILFDEAGNAYLSDFGIAKQLFADQPLTAVGGILGTPDYISPEQLKDDPVSPPSDLYSLGAVLYETLTGERPFPDVPIAMLLHKQLEEPFPPVSASRPDLPPQIDAVIHRATAKKSADRYGDALALAEAFRQAARGRDGVPPVVVDAGLPVSVPADIEIINPYKGLRAFQETDAADFYGRETLVEQLVNRLGDSRFLAVVGPSGGGKSSVVKAGLIPALRQEALPGSDKWFVAEMTPGSHPLEELELALLPIAVEPPPSLVEPMQKDTRGLLRTIRRILPDEEGAQLMLVIDQFEELFTLVEDEARRTHFLDSLVAAINAPRCPLWVVVTLRADFYDRPLQYQPLASLFKQHTELVLPLTLDELTWAIREPARRVGVGFEEGVVAAILDDVHDQPGALPLLQYALTELFEERQDRLMTRAAYQSVGGVLGALGQRAEELYAGLDETGQGAARQLFLRLVTLGEGVSDGGASPDTRRRVRLSEIQTLRVSKTLRVLMDEYGRHRLLTFDHDPITREPTVEVAHEALLREWPRLRRWLEQSRDDVRLQRTLAAAAAEWQQNDQDAGFLLRGGRLDLFSSWAAGSDLALTQDEHAYLQASQTAREQREAEEQARQERELEQAQQLAETERKRAEEQTQAAFNLRRRAYYLVGALVVAAVLAVAAIIAGRQATQNANEAQDNLALAVTREAEAVANFSLAATQEALAQENADLAATREAEALAQEAEANSQRANAEAEAEQRAIAQAEAEREASIAFSRELAAEAINNLGEEPERSVLLALQALKTNQTQAAEEALHRVLPHLRLLQTMAGHEDGFSDLAYSPDGSRLVSTSWDSTIRVWDAATGQGLLVLSQPEEEFIRERYAVLTYSGDGSYFATAGTDGTARVWDAATGELLTTFTGHRDIPRLDDPDRPNDITGLVVSPDSKTIVTSDRAGLVKLWDAATGAELKTLDLSETALVHWRLRFSSDGLRLIVFGYDPNEGFSTLRMIEIDSGAELLAINERMASFDVSPDWSRLIFTEAYENVVHLWDLDAMAEIANYSTGEVPIMAFSPDGSLFATLARDLDTVQLWETETGTEVMAIPTSHGHVSKIIFSPDGVSLATAGWDKLVKVWDITPDYELMTVQPFSEAGSPLVTQIRFSQDGTMLAASGVTGGVSIWNPTTGKRLLSLEGHDDWVGGLGFSPDGRRLASGSDDKLVKVWDTSTGELLFTLTGHEDWVNNIAYSPDGATIASIGNDAQSFIWDATTGEVLHQIPLQNRGWGIAYSPDGAFLATGTLWNPEKSENVTIWDVATGQAALVINNIEGADELLFSKDGSLLITGGVDGFVRIWDVETGQLRQEIEADQSVIYGASLSPDGTILATAAAGSDVRLWDIESGKRLLTMDGSEEGILLVEFTADGKQVVTAGGQSGYMRFLALSVEELIAIAESRVTRSLTEEECQEYLHMEACPVEE